MIRTTRAQRVALKRLYDRAPLYACGKSADELATAAGWGFKVVYGPDGYSIVTTYWHHPSLSCGFRESADIVAHYGLARPMTYREFRRLLTVGYDCIMMRWMGMWIGIERDGYTHS
jgi:hypothetical protein